MQRVHNVQLDKMEVIYPKGNPEKNQAGNYRFADGALTLVSKGWDDDDRIDVRTLESFKLPLKVTLVVKSTCDLWLYYNRGSLALNYCEECPNTLHAGDIFTGCYTPYFKEKLPLDDDVKITWLLDYSVTKVYANGVHYHTHLWLDSTFASGVPYEERMNVSSPLTIAARNTSTLTIKSISVTEC